MNKRQKYIKRKYFKAVPGDPFYYVPLWDESFHISPLSFTKILDIIINILEKEYDGETNWVKIT